MSTTLSELWTKNKEFINLKLDFFGSLSYWIKIKNKININNQCLMINKPVIKNI